MSPTLLERDLRLPPTRTRRRFGLKRLGLLAGAMAMLAAGVWFGLQWWTDGRFIESTDDAYVGGNLTSIAPHVPGFVASIPVSDHQLVQAGQLLVRLDARDYRAVVAHARAVVAAADATIDSLRAQLMLQQSTIQEQAANLMARTAQANYTGADAERYRSLATTAAGSRQDQQRTTSLDVQAHAAVLSAAAALQGARQRLPVLQAQITTVEAEAAQARADLETAQLNLGYTEIRSPIDGYVGNRAAQVGAYVAQGGYLLSIIPAHGLWVDANFKEDQLAGIAPGRIASLVADVLPGHDFRGHVVSVSPGTGAVFSVIPPENATGNFTKIVQRVPVRIALDGADEELALLRPGLSTTVRVDTRAERTTAP
ncbi:HlyD family secretion protein [Rhodopila sp.]|uniref:HlyD family secretion protein n=1 Tax=Rhodopila sp. TaxID=2480087 RepID=UPI003D099A97